jgi:hypothetical protein
MLVDTRASRGLCRHSQAGARIVALRKQGERGIDDLQAPRLGLQLTGGEFASI